MSTLVVVDTRYATRSVLATSSQGLAMRSRGTVAMLIVQASWDDALSNVRLDCGDLSTYAKNVGCKVRTLIVRCATTSANRRYSV